MLGEFKTQQGKSRGRTEAVLSHILALQHRVGEEIMCSSPGGPRSNLVRPPPGCVPWTHRSTSSEPQFPIHRPGIKRPPASWVGGRDESV